MAWELDGAVASRVEGSVGRAKLANPGAERDLAARVAEVEKAARHATAGVERGEGQVELAEAAAEDEGEQAAEGAEDAGPFGPDVELVEGGALVEVDDFGVDARTQARESVSTWRRLLRAAGAGTRLVRAFMGGDGTKGCHGSKAWGRTYRRGNRPSWPLVRAALHTSN